MQEEKYKTCCQKIQGNNAFAQTTLLHVSESWILSRLHIIQKVSPGQSLARLLTRNSPMMTYLPGVEVEVLRKVSYSTNSDRLIKFLGCPKSLFPDDLILESGMSTGYGCGINPSARTILYLSIYLTQHSRQLPWIDTNCEDVKMLSRSTKRDGLTAIPQLASLQNLSACMEITGGT